MCTRPFFFLPRAKRARPPTREKEGLGTRLDPLHPTHVSQAIPYDDPSEITPSIKVNVTKRYFPSRVATPLGKSEGGGSRCSSVHILFCSTEILWTYFQCMRPNPSNFPRGVATRDYIPHMDSQNATAENGAIRLIPEAGWQNCISPAHT